MTDNNAVPCRITITNEQDRFYCADCVCGIKIPDGESAHGILANAYDHFVAHSHVGFMFIDFHEIHDRENGD